MSILSLGLLALAVVVGLFLLNAYNSLVRERNLVKNAFAQIDVQLKRRYDLIPNLVETTKAYLNHEKETLEKVIQARNQAMQSAQSALQNPTNSQNMQNLNTAESALGQAMNRLLVVMESYPDLKANTTIQSLMEELSSTENKVSFARQAYNDFVMSYNNLREVFPNNLVSGFFNFNAASSFEITKENEKEPVAVKF